MPLFALPFLALGFVSGCATSSPPKPAAPDETAPSSPPPDPTPHKEETSAKAAEPPPLPALPDHLPPPAADCPRAAPLPPPTQCEKAIPQLADALSLPVPRQDEALALLEKCKRWPVGLVRVLRAERKPRCADQLVLEVVGEDADPKADLSQETHRVLVALGLAARLRRTVGAPPEAPPASSRAELEAYFAKKLFPWATKQAKAIHQMALSGARLAGYARGVVAIEAAMADMRFVDMARKVPLPKEMRQDREVTDVYYAALDEALEPRKARGRDAALVGLGEFASAGIISSKRLDLARQLISRVYAGNRILALDELLLPPAPPCSESTPLARIAASIESPHAAAIFGTESLSTPLTNCLLTRGLSTFLERSLAASATSLDRMRLARAHFDLGRTYFVSPHFQRAEALVSGVLDQESDEELDQQRIHAARLQRALAVALMAGPENPTELFRFGSRLPDSLGNLALLDALADSNSPLKGMAAFDAAYIRELSPPPGSVQFWRDLADRYQAAAAELQSEETKQEVRSRAAAARQTATAIKKQLE